MSNVVPLRDEIAVILHELLCDGRHDDRGGPCWTAWRQEADLVMIPVERALSRAWERGHRGCRCGPPARCHHPYQPPPHPCGHRSIERGCGGCDPSAIDYEFGGEE